MICFKTVLLLIALPFFALSAESAFAAQNDPLPVTGISEEEIADKYKEGLEKIFYYRDMLKDLHPFLDNLFPVAIVENDRFYVFDLNEKGDRYELVLSVPSPMPVPEKVRAAFALDFYDNKAACIVSGDVFDTKEGYATIFHEFIHCYQWNSVETGLRNNLPLAINAAKNEDYMWEISYPFPYDDSGFVGSYTSYIRALDNSDNDSVFIYREQLKEMLDDFDFQYMVWQEWKEGFALFIENMVREKFGLGKNMVGRQIPYSRTVFYAGGEGVIKFLVNENEDLSTDMEALFYKMMDM